MWMVPPSLMHLMVVGRFDLSSLSFRGKSNGDGLHLLQDG